MINEKWTRYIYGLNVTSNLRVKSMKFNLTATDIEGDISITDLQLQEGEQVTISTPNTSEMLERKYHTINERAFFAGIVNPLKEGVQPQEKYNTTPLQNRFFNFAGRGQEVIALPNIYHNDYKEDLVTSALDLTIIAKDDFDLLRVSTNDGALDTENGWYEHPKLLNNPLNYRYTREFYFGGGVAGTEIKLHANAFTASIKQYGETEAVKLPLNQGKLVINGYTLPVTRQRFMMAPYGSFRIRLEFYKQVTENLGTNDEPDYQTYLKNIGIGYYGYGEFTQFKGRAKY